MLSECLEIFQERLEEEHEELILNSYIPADGTYIFVDQNGDMGEPMNIKIDKKTRTIERDHIHFNEFCFYDYYSQLVSMNKPIDPGKIVHSNNLEAFWVKKDSVVNGKLTEAGIDRYYDTLLFPDKKYEKSKEASQIYAMIKEEIGEVDEARLERNRKWIKEHIFIMDQVCDMSKKEYLKIFFITDKENLVKEAKRYLLPNIYNSNDYNVKIEGKIFGMPDNNLGMNAKKPFLSVKTRKCSAPYLLDGNDAMLQKQLFDYLMNFAAAGKYNVYVDMERRKFIACKNDEFPLGAVSGFFLRLQKGKEVEIHSQDVIPYYRNKLARDEYFEYCNIVGAEHELHKEYLRQYKTYTDRQGIEKLIDEIFFSKMLINNYYTEADKLSLNDGYMKQNLISSREVIFDWIHKAFDHGILPVIKRISLELVKGSICDGYREKAARQMNLRWSLIQYLDKGGKNMGSILSETRDKLRKKINEKETMDLEDDVEYYFAVGQLADYLISLNKSSKKDISLINPFLNAGTDRQLQERLKQYFKKYNYAIDYSSKRVKYMMAMIKGYRPDGPVDQDMIIMGFTCSNLIYEKGEK